VPVTFYSCILPVPAVGAIKWVTKMHEEMQQDAQQEGPSKKAGNGSMVSRTATSHSFVSEPRRKWAVDAARASTEVAGWVTVFSSGLTFVTVKGAGHLVPAERPVSGLAVITAFLQGTSLHEFTGPKCKRLWLGRGYGDFCK
jgi:hypothetical protein